MTGQELWEKFTADIGLSEADHEEWSFGSDADGLAQLVVQGDKTATSSAAVFYEPESLPKTGQYSVVLNSRDEAVCIIRATKVTVMPFERVSAEHARKEGEGDKSLAYWQKVHKDWFSREMRTLGLEFRQDMDVVCEEFEVVYQ